MPRDLTFKAVEDKQLFDSIFKWQYEVDIEITEMEEKLNASKDTKSRKRVISEDGGDDKLSEKNGRSRQISINSSEITDFGPVDPLHDSHKELSS